MTGRLILKILLIIFLQQGTWTAVNAQGHDYPRVFGSDWQKALAFLEENEKWIRPVLDQNDISYLVAMAIVFPELVRYSALRDRMEITLLKTLYINLGDDYADFSIGPFQMKPSFAESVREQAPDVMRNANATFSAKSLTTGIKDYRKTIINDLEDPVSELNYLIAFIKICEKKFKGCWIDEQTKIVFLATAYNCGFNNSPAKIGSMTGSKFFNIRPFIDENFSYSDIGLYWYRRNLK